MALVSLKHLAKKKQATVAKASSSKLQERSDTKPRVRAAQVDLQLLLKGHAIQSSQLANQLARAEGAMIQFVEHGNVASPDLALEVIDRLERVRRSATEDLRQTAKVLEELKYPPVALAAVLSEDQRAFYASGSSRVLTGAANRSEGD